MQGVSADREVGEIRHHIALLAVVVVQVSLALRAVGSRLAESSVSVFIREIRTRRVRGNTVSELATRTLIPMMKPFTIPDIHSATV